MAALIKIIVNEVHFLNLKFYFSVQSPYKVDETYFKLKKENSK